AVAALRPEIRFDPPDRGESIAVDAVGALDRVEGGPVLRNRRAPGIDARIVHEIVEIVPDRPGEFRLLVEKLHDLHIGLQAARLRVEGTARNPAPRSLRPELLDAIGEIGLRGGERHRRHLRMRGIRPYRDLRRGRLNIENPEAAVVLGLRERNCCRQHHHEAARRPEKILSPPPHWFHVPENSAGNVIPYRCNLRPSIATSALSSWPAT